MVAKVGAGRSAAVAVFETGRVGQFHTQAEQLECAVGRHVAADDTEKGAQSRNFTVGEINTTGFDDVVSHLTNNMHGDTIRQVCRTTANKLHSWHCWSWRIKHDGAIGSVNRHAAYFEAGDRYEVANGARQLDRCITLIADKLKVGGSDFAGNKFAHDADFSAICQVVDAAV